MSFGGRELLWIALAAPAVSAIVWWAWRRRLNAHRKWAAEALWERLGVVTSELGLVLSAALLGLACLGAVLALSQPRWGQSETEIERQGVDVVFILDTSLSMSAEDVQPSRIYVARNLIRRMAASLAGHRLALIQAEGEPLVMAPLTLDAGVLDLLMDTAEPGSLPVPGTRLAPAVLQALELFPAGADKHSVIVVLSDGEDHGGGLGLSAQRLRDRQATVHVVGVGTPDGGPLPLAGGGLKQDENGETVVSRLGESVLEELARLGGGVYLRADGAGADPEPILDRILQMERRTVGDESVLAAEERFQWPLAAGAIALVGFLFARPLKSSREEQV